MNFKPFLVATIAFLLLQAQSCGNEQHKPTPEAKPTQAIIKPENEFELHEVRNGTLITTALLDRKTGRVWIWTKFTDAKKLGGPDSAFMEEQVVPRPVPTVRFQDLPK